MNFIIYDISLLVLFVIFVSIFLYRRRKNLKREGLLFLYKTSLGIKLINLIGNKYRKTLNFLSYASIFLGYCLMGAMFYLLGRIVWIYIFNPSIVKMIKVPPVMPLIPYLPQVFKLDFLPPFYFTYWIVIIAVIAVVHEFAHGIFAAHSSIKIKKTGFGFFPFFLPVFLAAFVELDEKGMAKKKKLNQMAILSAGTFANILTAGFFLLVLWIFFISAFAPAGVVFDVYSYSIVPVENISSINGMVLESYSYKNILKAINGTEFSKIEVGEESYILTKEFLEKQTNVGEYIFLYNDAPAINSGLKGAITEINNVKIDSIENLSKEIYKHSPGDKITITTKTNEETLKHDITLGTNPEDNSLPWLGIAFVPNEKEGVMGKVTEIISNIKKPHIYYEAKFGAGMFIYNLLWWLILISFSVALINMLPVGIFDGGRFLFLTVLAITKSRKKAENVFKFTTYLILFVVLLLMIFWAIGSFF